MKVTLFLLTVVIIAAIWIWLGKPKRYTGRKATTADLLAFLAPIQDKLDASRRLAAHITLIELSVDDPTTSKLGGAAYWPKSQLAPVDKKGKALAFLAQIRLDQIPALPDFPSQGLLQFFIQANNSQPDFKIVHWLKLESEFDVIAPSESNALPHTPTQFFRMQFELCEESLSISDFRFDRLYGASNYLYAPEAFAHENGISEDSMTNLLYEQFASSEHKLGGYPFFTQEDPRTEDGMELLFQLNSDDAAQMMWGDLGVANFFIAPSDLRRGDFSRVLFNWDCH
jgi:uncharacterized protein YwqG